MSFGKHAFKCIRLALLVTCGLSFTAIGFAQDELLDLLESELNRQMAALQEEEVPPYYMSYRVFEERSLSMNATFGSLTSSDESKERTLTTMVRVGDHDLDNFHEIRDEGGIGFSIDFAGGGTALPIENDSDAIRQVLWRDTDSNYRKAMDKLAKVKANVAVKVEEEDQSADFSSQQGFKHYEPPLSAEEIAVDRALWEDRIRTFSQPFLGDPDIFDGYARFSFVVQRKYFVSSDGGKIAQNRTATRLYIGGSVKSADGMVMPLAKSYFAFKPGELSDEQVLAKDVAQLVEKLKALKTAPVVEPYAGPALLSGRAAGVFFHEIFGHRIEGQRMKSESDSQTFKKKVGQYVLPEHMSVYMDPTRNQYETQDLNGYYLFDDEGMPGKPVTVVKDGLMNEFLMSRTPIENFPESNGHGRAEPGRQPVARQSNLIVESSKPVSMDALKQKLIEEAKAQGKKYGYLFESVVGGFTMTGRFIPNAFNVTPTEVYRIYVDGRPDELVRGVDLIGTPLAMFSKIEAAGTMREVFTGTCGAESGGVPVTAVSPALFVKQIEMQKKVKSQDRPPILPRPDASPDKGQS